MPSNEARGERGGVQKAEGYTYQYEVIMETTGRQVKNEVGQGCHSLEHFWLYYTHTSML